MGVYTAARIEIACFSAFAFTTGYYWPSWQGVLGAAFLVWAGLTMVKDEWNERRSRATGLTSMRAPRPTWRKNSLRR